MVTTTLIIYFHLFNYERFTNLKLRSAIAAANAMAVIAAAKANAILMELQVDVSFCQVTNNNALFLMVLPGLLDPKRSMISKYIMPLLIHLEMLLVNQILMLLVMASLLLILVGNKKIIAVKEDTEGGGMLLKEEAKEGDGIGWTWKMQRKN